MMPKEKKRQAGEGIIFDRIIKFNGWGKYILTDIYIYSDIQSKLVDDGVSTRFY